LAIEYSNLADPKSKDRFMVRAREERRSQNIEPQHPPNQEKADNCDDNVAYPLANRFWISKIEHVAMLASARKAELLTKLERSN
jgi:hypothetical protein